MSLWAKLKLLLGLNRIYDDALSAEKKEGHVTPKSILTSWTFWFNMLAGVYELLSANGVFTAIPPPWDGIVVVLGNILLRFKTTQPVSLTGGS